MTNTERKELLLKTLPNCTRCGCRLKLTQPTYRKGGPSSNEAVLSGNTLICFQCHRVDIKMEEINRLPFVPRMLKKFDGKTGLLTLLRLLKIRVNQFIYFKIRKGTPTGKMPLWLTPKEKTH